MLLRHLGQLSPAMQARFIKAGEALERLTADEQLEVASQLTMAILKAARHRFEGAAGDRQAYDTLCDRVEEWFTEEVAALRFGQVHIRLFQAAHLLFLCDPLAIYEWVSSHCVSDVNHNFWKVLFARNRRRIRIAQKHPKVREAICTQHG